MLVKILGLLILAAGGMVGLFILTALIGTLIGLLWFVVTLAVPALLIHAGCRLLTRDRRTVAY